MRTKHPLHSQGILGPILPLTHPSFPSTHLFLVFVGKCHGAGSLCYAGEKYGVQLPLSISFVSPSCPEQLWQCLCLANEIPVVHKQVSALLPHVTAFGWAGSAQDWFTCSVWFRLGRTASPWRFQVLSEDLRVVLLCHAVQHHVHMVARAGREGLFPAGL